MNGPRWWETSGRHGRSGIGFRGSWDGKGKTRRWWGNFSRRWFRRLFSSGWRCGWRPLQRSVPEGVPEQGGPPYHGKASTAASGKKLGVPPPPGGGNAGGGFGGGGGAGPSWLNVLIQGNFLLTRFFLDDARVGWRWARVADCWTRPQDTRELALW